MNTGCIYDILLRFLISLSVSELVRQAFVLWQERREVSSDGHDYHIHLPSPHSPANSITTLTSSQ